MPDPLERRTRRARPPCRHHPLGARLTSPPDEHVSGSGAPPAELERGADRDDASHVGAHARRLEVPPIEAPRHPLPERRRYFLSSFEPSGDYDAVIVAVTDDGRRRYFTTRDGARLAEVDEVSFERRRESGTRSMLELDERELGELEVELQFVRPVRGRDPIAEAEAEAAGEPRSSAEVEPRPRPRPRSRPRSSPRRTSTRTGQTSHSYTGRPSLRSRPRVSCSRKRRRGVRRGGRPGDRGVRGDDDGVDDDDIRARRCRRIRDRRCPGCRARRHRPRRSRPPTRSRRWRSRRASRSSRTAASTTAAVHPTSTTRDASPSGSTR